MNLRHNGRHVLSRRTLLRGSLSGASVTIGLPALEAMLNTHGTALADGTEIPKRFGVWFFGNGVNLAKWKPKTTGADWTPNVHTQPLASPEIKPYVTILSGMNVRSGSGQVHGAGPSAILTGTNLIRDNEDGTVGGRSIDLMVADQLGTKTFLRTLELASTKGTGATGSVFKWISHNGPDNPNTADSDPRSVFKRVFMGFTPGAGMPTGPDPRLDLRRTILDAVRQDAATLRPRLGKSDQLRFDQHLTSVRDIERRLETLAKATPAVAPSQCRLPTGTEMVTDDMVSRGNITKDLTAINKLQSDLLAMALACDRVRVFTFMFTAPASHDHFPEVAINETFHELFHREPDSKRIEDGITYEMARLADTAKSLRAVSEGAGNLLDACAMFATTCVSEGKSHSLNDYPFVVIGKSGGAVRAGAYHHLPGENASKVPLTLARAAGANLPEFGTGNMKATDNLSALLV
jgi:hypothetical protein